MNKKFLKTAYSILFTFAIIFISFFASGSNDAKAAKNAADVIGLSATYMGKSVAVGKQVNPSDVMVLAVYKDGSTERITQNLVFPDLTINYEGSNLFMVVYAGHVAQFEVIGKELAFIDGEYIGPEISVGYQYSRTDIKVKAHYSDGDVEAISDFNVSTMTVVVPGTNLIIVTYANKTCLVEVPGKATNILLYITVSYTGNDLVVGTAPNKTDLRVKGYYLDGTEKDLTSYNLIPATAENEGFNDFVVSVGEVNQRISIYARYKRMTSISVEYLGPDIVVGKTVNKDDFDVIATYNDGTQGSVKNFELSQSLIYDEGDNWLTVYVDQYQAIVLVQGVTVETADYSNSKKISFLSGEYATEITIAMPLRMESKDIDIVKIGNGVIKKVVNRISKTKKYMAFEVVLENDEWMTKFPITVKATLPQGFDMNKFSVYYTPNRKTIMARLNGEYVDMRDYSYEFKIYAPGTYVFLEESNEVPVTEIQTMTPEVKVKINRYFKLDTLVLPLDAVNKELNFRSTNEQVATVSATGQIKGISKGECSIVVQATDGSGVTLVIPCTVTEK
ncbi:MAG: Ig-like domain-containing protein [Lachnospiraceae bacterium]|nr:Ig-like domain-containing protein [Lachnospiraceae bacterium]